MNFSDAMLELLDSKKVAREGWNVKNMWICYMPPVTIAGDLINGRTRKFHKEGDLHVGGYFVMMTADGVWQPGWLASQTDMLSNDWLVVG